jgi:hypothetical protein
VRANGGTHALYTNVPEALYFHANRLSHELPDEHDPKTLAAFADTLLRRNALVVVFDESCGGVTNPDSLLARVPLREMVSEPTGRALAPLPPFGSDTFRAHQP